MRLTICDGDGPLVPGAPCARGRASRHRPRLRLADSVCMLGSLLGRCLRHTTPPRGCAGRRTPSCSLPGCPRWIRPAQGLTRPSPAHAFSSHLNDHPEWLPMLPQGSAPCFRMWSQPGSSGPRLRGHQVSRNSSWSLHMVHQRKHSNLASTSEAVPTVCHAPVWPASSRHCWLGPCASCSSGWQQSPRVSCSGRSACCSSAGPGCTHAKFHSRRQRLARTAAVIWRHGQIVQPSAAAPISGSPAAGRAARRPGPRPGSCKHSLCSYWPPCGTFAAPARSC